MVGGRGVVLVHVMVVPSPMVKVVGPGLACRETVIPWFVVVFVIGGWVFVHSQIG